MKVGVNGAVRDISDLKVGVNGAVRAVSEAYIGVNGAVKKVWPLIPIGYQVILDTVGEGTWICPASGVWRIEGHGGGGPGGPMDYFNGLSGGGGGGSGEEHEANLTADEVISYTIGSCPDSTTRGESTIFGHYYTFMGGNRSYGSNGGTPAGSLATRGEAGGQLGRPGKGGYGNKNKPEQTYGNGGDGQGVNSSTDDILGRPGAIILTYLG